MSTTTQFNPQVELNKQLITNGLSKTVYAFVTPETEEEKRVMLEVALDTIGQPGEYFDKFQGAWTGKQDAYHEEFFNVWHDWSAPVIELDRSSFPFYYPTAGASEPLRHLIYDLAARKPGSKVHAFEGEYEGYKAMAEAAGLQFVEHSREWHTTFGGRLNRVEAQMGSDDLFFISQPSAIDGNVWPDFNEFVSKMPAGSVVADITYVGAIPEAALRGAKFDLNQPAVRNVVFSLSKPYGVYYDRIGGMFAREEDLGLFGNKWFKNLTSLHFGTQLLKNFGVFDLPTGYAHRQNEMVRRAREYLQADLRPCDVFILATGEPIGGSQHWSHEMVEYLTRAGKMRVCLTPGMVNFF